MHLKNNLGSWLLPDTLTQVFETVFSLLLVMRFGGDPVKTS